MRPPLHHQLAGLGLAKTATQETYQELEGAPQDVGTPSVGQQKHCTHTSDQIEQGYLWRLQA